MAAVRTAMGFALAFVLAAGGCSPRRGPDAAESASWMAMGTVAKTSAKGGGELRTAEVKAVFARLEQLLSAHDPKSELSRLAPLPDAEVLARCSPEVRPCYAAAFRLRDETGGAFNPRWRGTNTLDLGAIAKGFAVDEAARQGAGGGETPLLVDLGGNLKAVRGTWLAGVRDPDDPGGVSATFALSNGMACATSGTYARGRHIRDGRTGAAAETGVASVTVIHPDSAMLADGLSTTLFILGRERGEAFLRARHPEARAIWRMRGETPPAADGEERP